jgi:hypothetical protein
LQDLPAQPRYELLHHLLVRRRGSGGGAGSNDRLVLGDRAVPPVDRHDDRLVQRIGQQRRQGLGAAAAGVAGLPLLEAGVQRRPASPGSPHHSLTTSTSSPICAEVLPRLARMWLREEPGVI